jgi:hypothetical protein
VTRIELTRLKRFCVACGEGLIPFGKTRGARPISIELAIGKACSAALSQESRQTLKGDAPQGLGHVEILTKTIAHQQERLPELARWILQTIVDQLHGTMARVREIEVCLARWHRHSRVSRLLATVPGVGVMGTSAMPAIDQHVTIEGVRFCSASS